MFRKKHNMASMRKKLMKLVDLDEPISFLDHVFFLDALNVNASRTTSLLMNTEQMFESRISVGATETLPGLGKPHKKAVAWSYDVEGHAQKCVERFCELANKKTEQLYKVSCPCLDDHHFKKEELE